MKTNKEAIEILKAYKQRLENSCSNQLDEDIKAFDLALKALEANANGTPIKTVTNAKEAEDYPINQEENCGADMRWRLIYD